MGLARNVLLAASKSDTLNHFATNRAFVKRAMKKFMPGEAPEDALAAAESLAKDGRGTVLTKLGEALTRPEEAQAVRDHYLGIFDQIKARGLPAVVSVKPSQLGLDLSQDACAAHLDALATKAAASGSFLWVDMEDSSYVDRTLALYAGLKAKHACTGLAMQAYLRRTPADLDKLMPLKPVIRLVKGAYAEPAHVAFPVKRDTDVAFFDISVRMLEAAVKGQCLPILGTHDVGLLDRLVARAKELRLTDDKYEIHMLYGIRDADQQRFRREGRTVKTLVSYGNAWYRWYMRRLAERPANVWFVVKTMFG
ncbi:MAG: proline dehydrogenase family protein [Gemmatimonadales bacterium]